MISYVNVVMEAYCMTFSKKILSFIVVLSPFLAFPIESVSVSDHVDHVEHFHVRLAAFPDKDAIEKEHNKSDSRQTRKYAVAAAGAVTALAILVLAYRMTETAKSHQNESIAKALEQRSLVLVKKQQVPSTASAVSSVVQPPVESGYVGWVVDGVKDFGRSTSSFVANSAMMIAAGVVINGVYTFLQNKISQAYQEETVLWYLHDQTKIPLILSDLKAYSVDYDLHAKLLSCEVFNQDAQIHMKAFVKDLLDSSQDFVGNDLFKDPGYFGFLIGEMKKKYLRQSGELEKLQDYVVPAVAKRDRALAQDHIAILFARDMARRTSIAELCSLLSKDVEKLAAFMMACGPKHKTRISDMVASCNSYLAHMELMLNSTPEQLAQMSKENHGMFTSSYEFERLFNEQVGFMHRYCKIVNK